MSAAAIAADKTPFLKMEAVGNDFVFLQETDASSERLPEIAIRLCSRRYGVGSDGLIVLGRSEVADLRMRMFNPDGTEDHCGNGMRCSAILWAGELSDGEEKPLVMETLAGLRRARVFRHGGETRAEVEMGEPIFAPERLPMRVDAERVIDYPVSAGGETLPATVISTGSLHAILFQDEERIDALFEGISPLIENHPLFPERTSVMWATVLSENRIRLRIWERGVGETLGCGTGASATMVAARLHGFVGDRAEIVSPGGTLEARWPGAGSIYLTGSANVVFKGRWPGSLG